MADVTTMVVTVNNLQCEKNKKKVKKVLCKIPEIENQVYDEKKNTVTITVVSCCPEKIKKKIRCKGGCMIQGIEVPPPPVKPPEEKPKSPKKDEKPAKPTPACPPKDCCKKCSGVCPPRDCCKECSGVCPSKDCCKKCSGVCPPRDCCKECSGVCPPKDCCKECSGVCPPKDCCKECSGVCPPRDCCKVRGPCYKPLPPPCNYPYNGCYGRPVCDCWGSGCRRCYLICEENPTSCTIM